MFRTARRSCCQDSRRRLVLAGERPCPERQDCIRRGDLDRCLDGKFRVSVVATGLEGSPLPASAPHAAVKGPAVKRTGGVGIRAVRPNRTPCVLSDAQRTL
ncbi:hypothetical protein E0H39_31325 [Rhizobium leguminosarum bv. viciae]|uniref:Uncharacterized protein n=1 Tax=Rhizobium leguminosarum TaxID=384 RepID=A0A6P0DBU6_RHILE|nr:hypothetical protein [Rhizobium leguminosarum]NKJ78778.1 hypothetical protein [Rhizobium leguminosarum bv. viciae]PUB63479.1 hypothetical protein DB728_17520 [Rhizobium leguminosarum bv. viciae USDA 2370]NEK49320.1 hypothetical protein [Rhizobium leguminosarum]NKK18027.1 hypothetical protein [Rhizobium leguminosarum bv. viciae]